jgi:hypothetical protein
MEQHSRSKIINSYLLILARPAKYTRAKVHLKKYQLSVSGSSIVLKHSAVMFDNVGIVVSNQLEHTNNSLWDLEAMATTFYCARPGKVALCPFLPCGQ